ncbi:hypothetical protein J4E06_06950 [Muricauda sp. NFXS6]|uniref:hypothetical protein n=1 Tax=Allomuricauda sp. NFXS6 TaxID=2819094 RepID=UPI0032DF36C5
MEQTTTNPLKLSALSGKGDYALSGNGKELGQLNYTNWLMGKARIQVEGSTIELKPVHIFKNTIDLIKDGNNIGQLMFSADLTMTIELGHTDDPHHNTFTIKNTGVFNPKFILCDAAKNTLCTFRGKNNWRKFKHDFFIDDLKEYPHIDLPVLLLCSAYAINIFFERISAL